MHSAVNERGAAFVELLVTLLILLPLIGGTLEVARALQLSHRLEQSSRALLREISHAPPVSDSTSVDQCFRLSRAATRALSAVGLPAAETTVSVQVPLDEEALPVHIGTGEAILISIKGSEDTSTGLVASWVVRPSLVLWVVETSAEDIAEECSEVEVDSTSIEVDRSDDAAQ